MNFLARGTIPFSEEYWKKIDETVVENVRKNLIGRQFLSLFGPLGAGNLSINVDELSATEEIGDGVIKTTGREFVELPQIFEDFVIPWRDIENSEATGSPLDLSRVITAAQSIAQKEDSLIFFGNEFLKCKGILNASGTTKISKGDWSKGENAFSNIAAGISSFTSKGIIGRYSLIVSPDLFVQFQRIQPSLGMMEVDRISKMLNGHLFNAPILGKNKAVLICSEPQYMDLAVGKDMETGYLETKGFNHCFRIMETAALRIKCKDAIIIFE